MLEIWIEAAAVERETKLMYQLIRILKVRKFDRASWFLMEPECAQISASLGY